MTKKKSKNKRMFKKAELILYSDNVKIVLEIDAFTLNKDRYSGRYNLSCEDCFLNKIEELKK